MQTALTYRDRTVEWEATVKQTYANRSSASGLVVNFLPQQWRKVERRRRGVSKQINTVNEHLVTANGFYVQSVAEKSATNTYNFIIIINNTTIFRQYSRWYLVCWLSPWFSFLFRACESSWVNLKHFTVWEQLAHWLDISNSLPKEVLESPSLIVFKSHSSLFCQPGLFQLPYILSYMSKNFGQILALKARGSTYMRGKLGYNFSRHRCSLLLT